MVAIGKVQARYAMPGAKQYLGSKSKVFVMQGAPFFKALFGKGVMIPACNLRTQLGWKGVMRAAQEKKSALMMEGAMSEVSKHGPDITQPKKGYSGLTPEQATKFMVETAEEVGFTQPLM